MAGGVEREDVFAVAFELGWTVRKRRSGKGYEMLVCPCGQHKTWVHKTPSNPNYYRERVNFIRRQDCNKR